MASDRRFVHLHEDRRLRTYAPSFFDEGYINRNHAGAEAMVAEIRGKLETADHFKLYEAGYYARGPILEIGRLHAKSTILLAAGANDAGHGHRVTSIEYEDRYLEPGRQNLAKFGLDGDVTLLQGDSSAIVAKLEDEFDTVFVDGDHSYAGVVSDATALRGKVRVGGVVMFHDYFHPLNESGEYGVRRAVEEAIPSLRLGYRGRFGGIALFSVA